MDWIEVGRKELNDLDARMRAETKAFKPGSENCEHVLHLAQELETMARQARNMVRA